MSGGRGSIRSDGGGNPGRQLGSSEIAPNIRPHIVDCDINTSGQQKFNDGDIGRVYLRIDDADCTKVNFKIVPYGRQMMSYRQRKLEGLDAHVSSCSVALPGPIIKARSQGDSVSLLSDGQRLVKKLSARSTCVRFPAVHHTCPRSSAKASRGVSDISDADVVCVEVVEGLVDKPDGKSVVADM